MLNKFLIFYKKKAFFNLQECTVATSIAACADESVAFAVPFTAGSDTVLRVEFTVSFAAKFNNFDGVLAVLLVETFTVVVVAIVVVAATVVVGCCVVVDFGWLFGVLFLPNEATLENKKFERHT